MKCRGVVERVDDGKAWIRLLRSEKCDGCPGCGALSSGPRDLLDLDLEKFPGLESGDEVTISMPERRFFVAFVLVFGVPVLATVAAYGLSTLLLSLFLPGAPGAVAVLFAAAAGLLSFYLASRSTDRPSFEPEVTILRRASSPGGDANALGARPAPSSAATAGGASEDGEGEARKGLH